MTTQPTEEVLRRAAEYLTHRGTEQLDGRTDAPHKTVEEPVSGTPRRLRLVAGGAVVAAVLTGSVLGAAAITGSLPVLGFGEPAAQPDTEAIDAAGSLSTDGRSEQATDATVPELADAGDASGAANTPGIGLPTAGSRQSAARSGEPTDDGDGGGVPVGPGPVISDIAVPGAVTAGATLSASWTVSDPGGLPDSRQPTSWMTVGGASGWVDWCAFPVEASFVSGTSTQARYTASCDVPLSVPDGTYSVFINAADAEGNPSEWGAGGEFTIVGGSSDNAAPRVTFVSIAPATMTPGGDLRPGVDIVVRWRASDESGVSYVAPWVFGPNGLLVDPATGQPWLSPRAPGTLVSGTPTDGVYEAVLSVSSSAPEGTYQLWFSAGDTLGNKVYESFTGPDGQPVTFQLRLNGPR